MAALEVSELLSTCRQPPAPFAFHTWRPDKWGKGSPGNMDRHDWRKQSSPSPPLPTIPPSLLLWSALCWCSALFPSPSLYALSHLLCCPHLSNSHPSFSRLFLALVRLIFTVFSFLQIPQMLLPLPLLLLSNIINTFFFCVAFNWGRKKAGATVVCLSLYLTPDDLFGDPCS